jgi:hypothetical protein
MALLQPIGEGGKAQGTTSRGGARSAARDARREGDAKRRSGRIRYHQPHISDGNPSRNAAPTSSAFEKRLSETSSPSAAVRDRVTSDNAPLGADPTTTAAARCSPRSTGPPLEVSEP